MQMFLEQKTGTNRHAVCTDRLAALRYADEYMQRYQIEPCLASLLLPMSHFQRTGLVDKT
jgi:hypothetical protein